MPKPFESLNTSQIYTKLSLSRQIIKGLARTETTTRAFRSLNTGSSNCQKGILDLTDNIVIRKYQPTDRESCRSLWRELTEWHRQIYQDPSIGGSHPEDYFDRHLANVGADYLWVAIFDLQVIGLIGLIVKEEEAEIEPLIVRQPYRSKGIGRRLVETVIAEAHKLGVRFLSVGPVARNIDAIKFFYKQGFRNIGHIELFIDFSNKQWKKRLKLFNRQFNY